MPQQLVYSTKLVDSRYIVPLILNMKYGLVKIYGLFDSGAKYTCIPERVMGKSVVTCYTGMAKVISGAIEIAPFRIESTLVNQCIVGNIDLGKQCVYVTADVNYKEVIIGMDLISQIDFSQSALRQELYLSKARQSYKELQIVTTYNVATALSEVLKDLNMYNLQAMAYCLQCLPENLSMPEEKFRKLISDLVERVS